MGAPDDIIEIRGLRALGRHGLLDEERERDQPFEIDLEMEVDLRRAGRTDDLADTVDYGAVVNAVRAVVAGEHSDLLEHLAVKVARAAMDAARGGGAGCPDPTAVTVTLRKLRPPVPADLASAGVRIRRSREELD